MLLSIPTLILHSDNVAAVAFLFAFLSPFDD